MSEGGSAIIEWVIRPAVATALGAVLGLCVKPLWKKMIFLLPSESAKQLTGDWYGYYLIIRRQRVVMESEKLTIAKDYFSGKFVVKGERPIPAGQPPVECKQKYFGKLWEEGGYLIIHMYPVTHKENIFIRFNNPIAGGGDEIKYGLWSALDFDNKPAVGPMILSRTQLVDARQKLDGKLDQFKVEEPHRIMQIFY